MAAVHLKTLQRAAEIAGDEQKLARLLGVVPSHLRLWLSGLADPPGDVFLRAVDLVVAASMPGSATSGKPATKSEDDAGKQGAKKPGL